MFPDLLLRNKFYVKCNFIYNNNKFNKCDLINFDK